MRVLLDECVPRRFGRALKGHDVRTVPQQGWAGKKNGVLLGLISASGFEVFLTVDQGIRYQQNLKNSGFAIVILLGATNQLGDLLRLVPQVLACWEMIKPGELVEIPSGV